MSIGELETALTILIFLSTVSDTFVLMPPLTLLAAPDSLHSILVLYTLCEVLMLELVVVDVVGLTDLSYANASRCCASVIPPGYCGLHAVACPQVLADASSCSPWDRVDVDC